MVVVGDSGGDNNSGGDGSYGGGGGGLGVMQYLERQPKLYLMGQGNDV